MTPPRPPRRSPTRDRGRSARRPPRPARGAPRPASRAPPPCCAGSTPWSSTTPAGTPRSPPAPPPARPAASGGSLTSASIPHPPRVPETFLPDEGESEPAKASGTNPAGHPGQLSPGRPELLTSSVERCRGRPARTTRAGRARLHYVEREDPGDGHPQPRRGRPSSRRGTSPCPQPGRGARAPGQPGTHQHQP